MKRFRFPLRAAAVVRAHREWLARQALASAFRALSQAEDGLAGARSRVCVLDAVIPAGRRGSFRPAEEAAFLQEYRRACAAEAETAKAMRAAEDQVDKARVAFIEANRQLKTVARLEERARAAHRAETARGEQADIDEMASVRVRGKNSIS